MVSCNDTITQSALSTTYDGANNELAMCQKSMFSTLESKVVHPTTQIKTGATPDVNQHSSPIKNECQLSLEKVDDSREYMMINPGPVALSFQNNAYVPIHTEVNTDGKTMGFNTELIKQVSSALTLQHPVCTLEKAQLQSLKDIPSLAVSGYEDMKCISASSPKQGTRAKNLCLLQKEIPLVISSPSLSADKSLLMETAPLAESSNYSLAGEETKCPKDDAFLQTQDFLSTSLDEVIDPSQVKVVSSSASATSGKKHSLNCILPRSDTSDVSLE